ncbi:MAG: succinyl-diaminopimelate desuccinylase [Bacillota bacterium]|jgi:succinyl-diaminopimelate desuccinylase|nr:succinyl-diaminopimelate desuccinylase [Bacillota bacterium]MDK2855447.1 succinyl-diaminopimelate desuccinylase [Bacillota bacterium]MDK2925348.1 succinyl-diaminopimelate desuccinylase [Bacillota bacterium]
MTPEEARRLAQEASDEIRALTQALIRTPSPNPPGREQAVAEVLKEKFLAAGLSAELVSLEEGRANVISRLPGRGQAPALLYAGHLDTVPPGETAAWTHDPYGGELSDGRLYGRGASDMKGGVAAQAMAAVLARRAGLTPAGDLIFVATCGEETDSLGAHAFRHAGGLDGVGGVVIAEPSANELFIAEKGALWLEVTTYGRTAHGSMPHLGINAVWKMHKVLSALADFQPSEERHPLLGRATVSLGTLNGGFKTNVVPDRATATFDMRTVPGRPHAEIVALVQERLDRLAAADPEFKAEVKVIKDLPSVATAADEPIVRLARRVGHDLWDRDLLPQGVNYYTDAAVLLPEGKIPFFIFGPGQPALAHQPEEYVEIEKLVEATAFFLLFLARWGERA